MNRKKLAKWIFKRGDILLPARSTRKIPSLITGKKGKRYIILDIRRSFFIAVPKNYIEDNYEKVGGIKLTRKVLETLEIFCKNNCKSAPEI